MKFESQSDPNQSERDANEDAPQQKPVFPISRRGFLKAAGTVALGAAAGKYSARQENREPKEKDAAAELLTKEKIQSALDDLRQQHPAT